MSGAPAEEGEAPRRTALYEQVGPDEHQKAPIDSIVVDYRERLKVLREESTNAYEKQFRALVEATRESIKDVFTVEQAARYDSLVAEYDRTREKERAANNEG